MCVLLLLLLGASVARAEDTVTLHVMARPLGDVISEVARQTNLPLGAARSAAGLPVFISVKEMPVSVFLKRLLEATGTEWLEEGNRRVLSNTGPLRVARAQEARQTARRLEASIRAHLDYSAKSSDWSPAGIEKMAQSIIARRDAHHRREVTEFAFRAENNSPYHLVMNEFLERVPAATLAAIPPNSYLVLSTRPNELQVALPYQPEAPARARKLEEALHSRLVKAGVRFAGRSGYDEAAPPPRPPVDRLIVRVERHDLRSFSISAFLVGPAGEVIANARYMPSANPESYGFTIGNYPKGTVRLSPLSAEFAKSYLAYRQLTASRYRAEEQGRPLGGGMFDGCTSDSLKQFMLQPTKHDPLSFVVADVLEGLADQTESQLIAMVPDSLLGRLAQSGGKGEVSFAALWNNFTMLSFNKDEHGWLIRPLSFALAADEFADRAGLERIVQTPTIRDLARYATGMGTQWSTGAVDFLWLDLLQAQAQRMLFHYRDQLRLLDAIPSQVWPVAQGDSRRLPLRSVPDHLKPRVALVMLMYASGIGYELLQGRTPTAIAQQESTELLEKGFADRVFIEVKRDGAALLALLKDGLPDRVLTPFTYGKLGPGAPSEVLIVDADQLTMGFTAGRGLHGQAILYMQRLREPRNVYTAPNLPEPLRTQVEQGRKASGPG
jgi:hypothetical protein